jgi:hypothetical protein
VVSDLDFESESTSRAATQEMRIFFVWIKTAVSIATQEMDADKLLFLTIIYWN